jgi:hypothetical protein
LRALAEWQFGQGLDYCRGCAGQCGRECPLQLNEPQTEEGWTLMRVAPACIRPDAGGAVLDVGAAIHMAAALGADPNIAADLLIGVVEGFNRAMRARERDG